MGKAPKSSVKALSCFSMSGSVVPRILFISVMICFFLVSIFFTISVSARNCLYLVSKAGSFSSSDGGFSYSMTGTPAQITADLQLLVYELNPAYSFPLSTPGRTLFTLVATDSASNTTTEPYEIFIRERSVAHIVTVIEDNEPGDPAIVGSLREALALAENNDFIVFDLPVDQFPAIIRLKSVLQVEKNVTLIGPGADQLVISGDSDGNGVGDVPLFNVVNEAQFSIEQVTLKNGFVNGWNQFRVMLGLCLQKLRFQLTTKRKELFLKFKSG